MVQSHPRIENPSARARVRLAHAILAWFPTMAMSSARIVIRRISKVSICVVILLTAGCYAGYVANHDAGGDTEAATGAQHDVPYSTHDAFLLTQDVLRG